MGLDSGVFRNGSNQVARIVELIASKARGVDEDEVLGTVLVEGLKQGRWSFHHLKSDTRDGRVRPKLICCGDTVRVGAEDVARLAGAQAVMDGEFDESRGLASARRADQRHRPALLG